jgi:hypothetical protein
MATIGWLLASGLVLWAFVSVYRGGISHANGVVSRRENPILFYLGVGLTLGLALLAVTELCHVRALAPLHGLIHGR